MSLTLPLLQSASQLISKAWAILLESLQVSVASVRLVASYKAAVELHTDMSGVYEQTEKLDRWVVLASARAEARVPVSSSAGLDPASELGLAQVMRRLSRIRLSR